MHPIIYLPDDAGKPCPGFLDPGLCPPEARDLWRGLSLAWIFNGGAGERSIEDVSGNGLHGLFGGNITGTSWSGREDGPTIVSAGGASDVIHVADPAADYLDNTTQITVEMIFRMNAVAARQGLVGKYQAATGARSWLLYFEPPTLRFQVSSDGAAFEAQNSSGFTWSAATWYHVIVRYNAGAWTLDVNGASVSTDGDFAAQLSIFGGTKELHVGQRWGTTGYTDPFAGQIASLRIWRGRALEDDQVALLFAAPWEMYRQAIVLPYPAADHEGGATPAGPWQTVATVAAGVQSHLITGLINGVSYDVRVITRDTTGNASAGSTPETETPVAEPAVFRGVRSALTSRPNPPPHWRLIP